MKFKVCCVDKGEPFIFYMMSEGYVTVDKLTEIQDEIILQLEDEVKGASETDNTLIIEANYTEPEYQEVSDEGDYVVLDGYWSLEVTDEEKIIFEPMPF